MKAKRKPSASKAAPAAADAPSGPVRATLDDVVKVVGALIDGDSLDMGDLKAAKQRIRLHRESLPDEDDEE